LTSNSALGCLDVIRKGYWLLIKHAFPAQCVFESLGGSVDWEGVVIGVLDGGLRGDPYPGAVAVHVNKRCRVAKVDDNGGAGANVSYQLPREPPIVLYLVHTCHLVLPKPERALSASLRGAPAFQIRTESTGMHLERQPLWSPNALSNSADATSTVSFGQAMASSNGFVVATDPTSPLTAIHRG
jgi:hypothetical protein